MATWCLYDKLDCAPSVVFMDVPVDDEDLLERLSPLFKGSGSGRYDLNRVDEGVPAQVIARILHGEGRQVNWRDIAAQVACGLLLAPAPRRGLSASAS